MRKNYPDGFALDASQTPHVTVLQCFVNTADLEKVFSAVENIVLDEKPETDVFTATGFYFIPYKGLGLAGITAKQTAQ